MSQDKHERELSPKRKVEVNRFLFYISLFSSFPFFLRDATNKIGERATNENKRQKKEKMAKLPYTSFSPYLLVSCTVGIVGKGDG